VLGLALGEPVGVAAGGGERPAGVGAGLELADGEAAGDAAVSASAAAGVKRLSPPARPRTAIVTLRRARSPTATEGG
jgi:hypothetical protein